MWPHFATSNPDNRGFLSNVNQAWRHPIPILCKKRYIKTSPFKHSARRTPGLFGDRPCPPPAHCACVSARALASAGRAVWSRVAFHTEVSGIEFAQTI